MAKSAGQRAAQEDGKGVIKDNDAAAAAEGSEVRSTTMAEAARTDDGTSKSSTTQDVGSQQSSTTSSSKKSGRMARAPSETSTDGGASTSTTASNKHHQHRAQHHHQIHLSHHGPHHHHHHHARGPPTMRGGAGRHRSAIGLVRPQPTTSLTGGSNRNVRGHGRVASSGKLSQASTEDVQEAVVEEDAEGEERKEELQTQVSDQAETEPPKSTIAEEKPAVAAKGEKKRMPVTFTMGSMEDESDEEEQEPSKARPGLMSRSPAPAPIAAAAANDEVSDEWASDSSTDSEEERRRTAERKKRMERERLENMFKKVPVRSQSAADVRLLGSPESDSSVPGTTPAQPIRGILSSIFHPEQQHHGHYQGAGAETSLANLRPHASVADLARLRPSANLQQPLKPLSRRKSPDSNVESPLPRPPSVGNLGALGSFGGLKMSKSAVALPVLSATGSRSSANVSRSAATEEATGGADGRQMLARSVHAREEERSDEEDAEDCVNGTSYGGGGAVDRLNELSLTQHSKQRQGRPLSVRSGASDHQQESGERRRMSGGSMSGTSGGRIKRSSNSSLDIQVHPDLNEDEIRQQRRTSAPYESSSVTAPVMLPQRSRSAVNVPDVGLPQSPRTTRRNMLRDELSESLRQNLLWERQSRNRMLGIGPTAAMTTTTTTAKPMHFSQGSGHSSSGAEHLATAQAAPGTHSRSSSHASGQRNPVNQSSSTHHHRPQSVLGGNALRPLTARSTSGNAERESTRYTGDFHHTGW